MTKSMRRTASYTSTNYERLQKMRATQMLMGKDMSFTTALNNALDQFFNDHPEAIGESVVDENEN